MNFKGYHILVTKHARDRLRERFFFKFINYFSHKSMTENLIIAQLQNAKMFNDWKMVPFYVNRIGTEHGLGTEIYRMSGVWYVCTVDHTVKRVVVKTCLDKFFGYR